MITIPKYHPGQTAKNAHKFLQQALEIEDKAHQSSLDWFGDILERQLYRDLGFSSMNQYAKVELGFCRSKIGDYMNLCKKLNKLPVLKEALKSGKFGYTFGRVISSVADESNEKKLVEFALNNSRQLLEKEIKRVKVEVKAKASKQTSLLPEPAKKLLPLAVPVQVKLEMSPIQFSRYEALLEKIQKTQNISGDQAEVVLEIMARLLEMQSQKGSSREALSSTSQQPAQIHIHHCPECESARVQTSRGEMEIGKSEWERCQCDSKRTAPGKRNTSSIPPSIRQAVLAKARNKCQRRGCDHTRFLEVHHVVPRSLGGGNEMDNLVCYCSACHSLVHRSGLGSLVKEASGFYGWYET